uniref:Uncharacterized protein n=1 Tax=Escherichia coli TaxID=562 RepID=A0A1J0AK78_ECOLX|nr:Conserved hypothetical protein in transposon Tn903 [Escherichia coli]
MEINSHCLSRHYARCDGNRQRKFAQSNLDFPLAFTEDLQPGGINYQVCDFTPGGRFETDINRLCPPADTAVIRAA